VLQLIAVKACSGDVVHSAALDDDEVEDNSIICIK
jgi:hypothetical protein